jgi:hypothetical protein
MPPRFQQDAAVLACGAGPATPPYETATGIAYVGWP